MNDVFSRETIPLVGESLSRALAGAPPEPVGPIGLPSKDAYENQLLLQDLAPQGLSLDDLTGGGSIISRFFSNGPLGDFVDEIGGTIGDYEALREVLDGLDEIEGNPPAALNALMEEHGLKQSDLSEIGSQGVVSEILSGKRQLNVRQIKMLSKRFKVSPAVFI